MLKGCATQAVSGIRKSKGVYMKSSRNAQVEPVRYGVGMTVAACVWLGLFPLLQGGTYSSITYFKWVCMFVLSGVTVVCFAVDLFMRRLSRPRLLPLLVCGALALWTLISCLASPYSDAPWWIGAGRREGLATQLCYWGLFFLFVFARVKKEPVVFAAGFGVIVFLVIALLQRAGGNPFGLYPSGYSYENVPLFQSTIGHVDMGTGYLLILSGLFLSFLVDTLRDKWKLFKQKEPEKTKKTGKSERFPVFAAVLSALFFAVCVFLIVTMDVQFGLLTLAVLLVWTAVRFLPAKWRLPVLIVLLALVLVLVWALPFTGGTLFELHEVLHGHFDIMYGSGRIGVWTYCVRLLSQGDRLLLGSGADTFALRFNTFLQQYYADHPDAEKLIEYFDNPHNEYLALLINCGIPALILHLVLLLGGCFGKSPWRDSVLCYSVQALLSFSVCLVAPMFWVVLGLAWGRTD